MDAPLFKLALALSLITENDEETIPIEGRLEILNGKEIFAVPADIIKKYQEKINKKEIGLVISNLYIEKVLEEKAGVEWIDFIYLKEGTKSVKVFFNQIVHIKKRGDYTLTTLLNKKEYVTKNTISWFVSKLPSHQFMNIHAGHIVNMKYISHYIDNTINGVVIMIDNKDLDISKRKKQAFDIMIKQFLVSTFR